MFGMFAKANLTLAERAALMLTLVQASLMGYLKHNQWLSEDHRATVIDNWLKRNDRKAGIAFRAKISRAADEMLRFLVSTQDSEDIREVYALLDKAQYSRPGESAEIDYFRNKMLGECERYVIAKGLEA